MNQAADQPLPKIVKCPKCLLMDSERKLDLHLKRVHDPEKVKRSIATENRVVVEAARDAYLATLVRRTNCEARIQLTLIKRHFAEIHSSPAPAEMLVLVGLSERVNMFKSDREREAYWRKFSGVHPNQGEDLFDKTRVMSGGAFGLGKSRKH